MSEAFGPGARALAGLAARRLGWCPDAFWRATPAELFAALGPYTAPSAGVDRATLQRLMERDDG